MVLFSIIIPTYNSEKILATCLQSVVDQSFPNKEVIIMDGLSTDSTLDIVQSYQDKYKFITCYSEKDAGVYDAMNRGVKKAKGNWLYFLGSDDYLYDKDVLKKVYESINDTNENYDFIYGNVYSPLLGKKYDGEFSREKIVRKNICHQAIFYNKSIFEKVGFYNLKYKIAADFDLNLRCFFNDRVHIKFIDIIIAYYSEGGLSSSIIDTVFFNDFNDIIKRIAYKRLPLMRLKPFCSSNSEFILLSLKRILNYYIII